MVQSNGPVRAVPTLETISKELSQNQSNFCLLSVPPDGEPRVYTSAAFGKLSEKWFTDKFKAEAVAVAKEANAKWKAQRQTRFENDNSRSVSTKPKEIGALNGGGDGPTSFEPQSYDQQSYHLNARRGSLTLPPSSLASLSINQRQLHELSNPISRVKQGVSMVQEPTASSSHENNSVEENDNDSSTNSTSPPPKRRRKMKAKTEADAPGESNKKVEPKKKKVTKELPSQSRRIALDVTDADEVEKFYKLRITQIQQNFAKSLSKIWIKIFEPRKQSVHPYKGGATTVPDWWPPGLIHREPDHIHKEPRIILLTSMCMRRPSHVSIRDLEQATNEGLTLPRGKKMILQEIYQVLKHRQRFEDGLVSKGFSTLVESDGLYFRYLDKKEKEQKEEAKAAEEAKGVDKSEGALSHAVDSTPDSGKTSIKAERKNSRPNLPAEFTRPSLMIPENSVLPNGQSSRGVMASSASPNGSDLSTMDGISSSSSTASHGYTTNPALQLQAITRGRSVDSNAAVAMFHSSSGMQSRTSSLSSLDTSLQSYQQQKHRMLTSPMSDDYVFGNNGGHNIYPNNRDFQNTMGFTASQRSRAYRQHQMQTSVQLQPTMMEMNSTTPLETSMYSHFSPHDVMMSPLGTVTDPYGTALPMIHETAQHLPNNVMDDSHGRRHSLEMQDARRNSDLVMPTTDYMGMLNDNNWLPFDSHVEEEYCDDEARMH